MAALVHTYPSWQALCRDYPELDDEAIRQALRFRSMDLTERLASADAQTLHALLSL